MILPCLDYFLCLIKSESALFDQLSRTVINRERINIDAAGYILNRLFYEQLKADREQQKRKYGRHKGAATRGLSSESLFPQVMYRPLSDYERLAQGGAAWNN